MNDWGFPILLADGATTSKLVAAVLWSGLILLSAALVVIMKTRWGQSRPISKCIGLSVLAHILLLAYGYGTNLIAIPVPEQPVVKVKLLKQKDKEQEQPKQPEPPKVQKQPWERLEDSKQLPIPMPPTLPREQAKADPPAVTKDPPMQLKPKANDPVAQTTQDPPQKLPTSKIITPLKPAPAATSDKADKVPDNSNNTKTKQPKRKTTSPRVAKVSPEPRTLGPVEAQRLQSSSNNSSATKSTGSPPANLPNVYRMRVTPRTEKWLRANGGSTKTEKAVELALAWLARNQAGDGRWDARRHGAGQERHVLGQERGRAGIKADTAMTGLAMLAFLGAGHTHKYGKYQQTVGKAIDYLKGIQKGNGSLEGDATLFARMYCHGMATFGLAEAYAMTKDKKLRPYVERAIKFTINTQNDVTGGWRYQDGDRGDMSQFGWQLLALKSAEAGGIAIPRKTRQGMLRFLRSVSFGRAGGLASYRPGRAKSRTMTAEALVCRYFLNTSNQSLANEAVRYIRQQQPSPNNRNFYYWYYGTLAMHKVEDGNWRAWNRSLQQALVSTQSRGGRDDGSWSPQTRWGGYGGRVYTTAMAALCLEVYYRFK